MNPLSPTQLFKSRAKGNGRINNIHVVYLGMCDYLIKKKPKLFKCRREVVEQGIKTLYVMHGGKGKVGPVE